ncbi:MAG: exodeoxyribonuclease VII large subunit [Candidatus Omnitrophica bacterium]|nr:exodeoxyribonuclease VII large subunit [Candidatus Omnitrophota bacterium]
MAHHQNTPDLFIGQGSLSSDKRIFTVSEITADIKLVLENTFAHCWVEGEISNFKAYPSGHFYFSLKDGQAVLAAVMFSRANRGLTFKPEDGQKVICCGKIDVYPPRGNYQLIVETIEPKGIGAQQLAFEQLKNKLLKEGLFDPAHKRQLPLMPFRVGIVTSKAGAAVRDILQILKKGAPCVDVVIRSVKVQGEGAASEIAAGIEDLNRYKEVDVIIVSRGGGSIEDLWSFNEEVVARAVYNSAIPIISAVGHQINTTLSDLVADVFVETPSAAAKIIVDKKHALLAELEGFVYEMTASSTHTISTLKNSLIALRHMLKSPLDRLLEKEQLVDDLMQSLSQHTHHYVSMTGQRLSTLLGRLDALSPLAVLSRGYSLTLRLPEETIMKEARLLKPGDVVRTALHKGSFISTVQEVVPDERKTTI